MNKIFCVVGRSGSGKSTIVDKLVRLHSDEFTRVFNISTLTYHTTRKPRKNESSSEYIFNTEEEFEDSKTHNEILEQREYITENNDILHYYTLKEDIDLDKHNYIVKASFDQYNNYKEYFGEDYVVLIYVYTDLKRLLNRTIHRAHTYNDMVEACRRFISDDKQFKDLLISPSHIVFNNTDIIQDIDKAVDDCLKIIKNELQ